MLSQQLIDRLAGDQSQSLVTLLADWWFLIALALVIAAVLVWLMVQLVRADLAFRRAMAAARAGEGGEETAANVAYYHARRQTFIRPILILMIVFFFVCYPVLKSWYGLE